MEYMYSKITYKQSELAEYVSKRLVDDGYIDANINKKISDEQLFRSMDKLEFQFKVEKLLKLRQNTLVLAYVKLVAVESQLASRPYDEIIDSVVLKWHIAI